MKAIVYSTKNFEKELLAKANFKKHDITLISNQLNIETVSYAEGKDAVIVFCNDDLSTPVIEKLAEFGIKYIATRSGDIENINRNAAAKYGIKIAHVPFSPESIAEHVLMLVLALNRKLTTAIKRSSKLDFSLEGLTGFNLKGKTIGIIGYDNAGKATSKVFKNLGCKVLVHDTSLTNEPECGRHCDLDELLKTADIISLHISFKNTALQNINRESLSKMKMGTMLINTSRGGLLDITDILEALKSGQLGYLGMDVWESEPSLSDYRNQTDNPVRNPVLKQLIDFPNVIITPPQAFLTKETLEEIAYQTIKNLDNWQAGKCVGKACACANNCAIKHE